MELWASRFQFSTKRKSGKSGKSGRYAVGARTKANRYVGKSNWPSCAREEWMAVEEAAKKEKKAVLVVGDPRFRFTRFLETCSAVRLSKLGIVGTELLDSDT